MTRYAEGTAVTPERSRNEIERTLARYGATEFAYASRLGEAAIAFTIKNRQVRINLPLPPREQFDVTPQGNSRSRTAADEAFNKAVRQRWRALALVIKAKLEAVESGISTLEREFLADVVVPSTGRTIGEHMSPQLERLYAGHGVPELLPGGAS